MCAPGGMSWRRGHHTGGPDWWQGDLTTRGRISLLIGGSLYICGGTVDAFDGPYEAISRGSKKVRIGGGSVVG